VAGEEAFQHSQPCAEALGLAASRCFSGSGFNRPDLADLRYEQLESFAGINEPASPEIRHIKS